MDAPILWPSGDATTREEEDMLTWLKSLLFGPQPAGPPQTLRAFNPAEPTISRDLVRVENEALIVETDREGTVNLYELQKPEVDQCILTYRATARAEALEGRAYLEMACKFPKVGEHRSRGLQNSLSGPQDWTSVETQVFLDQGQKPEHLGLNLVVEGPGRIVMKDVEVLSTPVS